MTLFKFCFTSLFALRMPRLTAGRLKIIYKNEEKGLIV